MLCISYLHVIAHYLGCVVFMGGYGGIIRTGKDANCQQIHVFSTRQTVTLLYVMMMNKRTNMVNKYTEHVVARPLALAAYRSVLE